MSLGNNIKKIREIRNISIDEMVKSLSTFKATYISIERNLIKPKSSLLTKIANILNVEERDIINYREEILNNQILELDIKNLKDIVSSLDTVKKPKKLTLISTPVTKTKINVVLEDLSIKEVVYKKPILLTSSELFQIGDRTKTVDVKESLPSDILIDEFGELNPNLIIKKDRSFSSKILNWIEPYVINGVEKTLFFTEINTGLKVGDRVFIVNGNYDSNIFLIENKYKRKTDGYLALFVDNCRVVLDIDYINGKLPYIDDEIDRFINVYYIDKRDDFIQANRQVTSRGGKFDYKFSKNQNNIAFFNTEFEPLTLDWGSSLGITQSGFYVKDGDSWLDISVDIMNGSFSSALSLDYDNNNRIRINNGSFTFSNNSDIVYFFENTVYKNELDKFSGTYSWIVDNRYSEPFITKSNFRNGDFNGVFNSGVFGTQDKRITWDKSKFTNATWNTGVLLNTDWLSGEMKSINSILDSYISDFDENEIPYQKLNGPNNNDIGFNYIEGSNLINIVVENGFFNRSTIGQSVTYSTVEQYLTGITNSSLYSFIIDKAVLNKCDVIGGLIKDSEIINTKVVNTKNENIKSINSNYKSSIIKDSIYIGSDDIKILAYDEFTIAEKPGLTHSHKIYKFYISQNDYKKLKIKDNFYINGLSILDKSKYPLNFFDRRFKISTWTEYFESYNNEQFTKRGIEVGAFLSTPGDNEWKLNYIIGTQSETVITEQNQNSVYHSVDIVISTQDIEGNVFDIDGVTNELPLSGLEINKDFSQSTGTFSYTEPNIIGDNVDISLAYIVNSDFESGILENTDWSSGNHINCNNDVNIVDNNFGTYSILAITQSSQLLVKTGYTSSYIESSDILNVGDIVFLGNIEYQTTIGDIIKLGDTYKIVEGFGTNSNQVTIEEIGTNIISSITQSGGVFLTKDAQNRYNYIHKAKINKSKISSGIFRRPYITESFIENDSLDISDKDFNNIPLLKKLVISDCIFKDNSNILSSGLYMNSYFIGGNDKFENGIVYNSIWNGLKFSRGLFKESRWVDGVFNDGLFYNNKSFNGITSSNTPLFSDERVKSYYKDGITSITQSNNRYSWQNGEFNNGGFFKSDWENGEFNGGEFIYSKFYNGNINGGTIGDKNTPILDTVIHNGNINFTTVENALVFASDNSSGLTSSIIWRDGRFNGGEFKSIDDNIAIWENGQFNNGNFEDMAVWKNGKFNGGNFLSTRGWTMSNSLTQSDYTWQDGEFNGGEFGNASGASNSTWFTGEFNGGKFVGRVWNNGVFTNGDFIGSATYSAIRNVTATQSNALLFTDSFTSSYYGLWRDGVVSSEKDDFIRDRQTTTPNIRNKSRAESLNVSISNSLWLNGTFSHSSGSIRNSVWLNGVFERGTFFNSSFNPYVRRDGSTQSSFELSDSCKWINGDLSNSDFYISVWEKGKFDKGDAYGMIWKDGVCNYMNAFNIFWEGGLWRNGNWYGSYINYNGTVEDDFNKQILLRGVSWSGTQSMHLWNIFNDSSPVNDFSSASASKILTDISVTSG
jgi:transcriptional regulator with XRE-family HTH domain